MKPFFDAVRPIFGGVLSQSQVNGLETLLAATANVPLKHRAYILATAKHETANTMQPVRETLARTSDEAVRRLDSAWRRGKLKWVKTPYWRPDHKGRSWHGRGYVQLTHERNYDKAGRALGVDLIRNPDAAMNPEVAAKTIVRGMQEGWFTGKKLSDYEGYVSMRRIVNGTDRAELIAAYARDFEKALRKLPAGTPDKKRQSPWAALISALAGVLAKVFGGRK